MKEIHTNSIGDNIEVALYEIDRLQRLFPNWSSLSKQEKLNRIHTTDADDVFTTHNAVIQPYREHLAKLVNPDVTETAVDAGFMAFGDDDTPPTPEDTHLGNEVYRDVIDDPIDRSDSEEYAGVLLIQSDEAVGLSLLEVALVTESDAENSDDIALNRALLEDDLGRLDPKDEDHAVTVTVELSYRDESQVS